MNLTQSTALIKQKVIVDFTTGETIALKLATDDQVSDFLTKLNEMRKSADKVEKMVKKHIKEERITDKWEDDKQYVGNHQVSRSYRKSFDKKRFETDGTEDEKAIVQGAEDIKEKFTKLTEVITIR